MATVTLTPKDPAKEQPIEVTSDKVNDDPVIDQDEATEIKSQAGDPNLDLTKYKILIDGKTEATLQSANASATPPADPKPADKKAPEKNSSGGIWSFSVGPNYQLLMDHSGPGVVGRVGYDFGKFGVEGELGYHYLSGSNNSTIFGLEAGANATYKFTHGIYFLGGASLTLIDSPDDKCISEDLINQAIDSQGGTPIDLPDRAAGACYTDAEKSQIVAAGHPQDLRDGVSDGIHVGGATFHRTGRGLMLRAGAAKLFNTGLRFLGQDVLIDVRGTAGTSLGKVSGHNEGDDDLPIGGNLDLTLGATVVLQKGSTKKGPTNDDPDKDDVKGEADLCPDTPLSNPNGTSNGKSVNANGCYEGKPLEEVKVDRVVSGTDAVKAEDQSFEMGFKSDKSGKIAVKIVGSDGKEYKAKSDPAEAKAGENKIKVTPEEKLAPGKYRVIVEVTGSDGKTQSVGEAELEVTGEAPPEVNIQVGEEGTDASGQVYEALIGEPARLSFKTNKPGRFYIQYEKVDRTVDQFNNASESAYLVGSIQVIEVTKNQVGKKIDSLRNMPSEVSDVGPGEYRLNITFREEKGGDLGQVVELPPATLIVKETLKIDGEIVPATGRNNTVYAADAFGVNVTPTRDTYLTAVVYLRDNKKREYTYTVGFEMVKGGEETFLPIFPGGRENKPKGRFVVTKIVIIAIDEKGDRVPDAEDLRLPTESYIRGTNQKLKTELIPVTGSTPPPPDPPPDPNKGGKKKGTGF